MTVRSFIILIPIFLIFEYDCYSQTTNVRSNKSIKTVKIGDQEWMTENLNVDKFRNGDPIFESKKSKEWVKQGKNNIPSWIYSVPQSIKYVYQDLELINVRRYEDLMESRQDFGTKLYNYSVVSDERGVCPSGFHIPSKTDIQKLIDFLGDDSGKMMKTNKEYHWVVYSKAILSICPNCENWSAFDKTKYRCQKCNNSRTIGHWERVPGYGSNSTGFSGIPYGILSPSGDFRFVYSVGGWWCKDGEYFSLTHDSDKILLENKKINESAGLSIRCIKD